MGQHCIIIIMQPGNDVSIEGVTSQTIGSQVRASAYNCFALDLINSVVVCTVLISPISMQEGIG